MGALFGSCKTALRGETLMGVGDYYATMFYVPQQPRINSLLDSCPVTLPKPPA